MLSGKCIAITVILFALMNSASAATFFVAKNDPSCSDAFTLEQNDEQHPWCTISKRCPSDGSYVHYIPIRDVPAGSTVIVKAGEYGAFGEDARSNCYPDSKTVRSDWTTYKAADGEKVVFDKIELSGHTVQGSHYLIFEGFELNGRIYFEYTDNVQIKNFTVKTEPADYSGLETGIFKPYFLPNGHAIQGKNSNNVVIENNDISNVYRAISGTGNNWAIKNNHLHYLAEDGINAVVNNFLIENNLIHDSVSKRTTIDMHGTKTGDFIEGEEAIQEGTGAKGIVYKWQTASGGYLPVWQTTEISFKTQAEGGSTITGRQSNATVSNITLVDGAHIDAIHIESANVKNITIRNNTAYGFSNQGISLYGHGGMQNAVLYNNLVYDSGKGFVVSGVKGVDLNNNTTVNAYVRLENSTSHAYTSIINNMYNNSFNELAVNGDVGQEYIQVVNHGNNIFGNNPTKTGAYPFSAANSEVVNSNVQLNESHQPITGQSFTSVGGQTVDPCTMSTTGSHVGAIACQGSQQACAGTDASCGAYPICQNCNLQDGCDGNTIRNYYCTGTSCTFTEDNCSDCTCNCGDYNATESLANNNCTDSKDNDCDTKTDTADEGCQTAECTQDSDCPTGQTCQNSACAAECIDNTKLTSFIGQWKQGQITMLALMQKMKQWKAGTGCQN